MSKSTLEERTGLFTSIEGNPTRKLHLVDFQDGKLLTLSQHSQTFLFTQCKDSSPKEMLNLKR